MGRNLVYIVLFFLITASLWAQNHLKGAVVSLDNIPLGNASVVVKDENNKTQSFSFSDEQGKYHIEIKNIGSFTIEVNRMGFEKSNKVLLVKENQNQYEMDFHLVEATDILQEMIIEIDNPVQVHGDTIVYDAKAFSTGREQVVEDLLKNIPNVTVEKDGTIKYNNVQIEKVMVEGDDFFNRGYSLLTKNMPNKPLNKVEILKNYSNNKLLKGVEQSDKVAINLTIDDEYRNIWFGDITLGYGIVTENRYKVKGNLMNFGKKYKSFLTYGLNNVGADDVGRLDNMFYNNEEMESIGNYKNNNSLMNLNGNRVGLLKDERTRINNAEFVSLSTIIPLSEKFKIKVVGFLGGDENYAFNRQMSVTDVEGTYFENIETNNFKSHLKNTYVSLLGSYDISKTTMLQFGSVWNQGKTDDLNELTFNGIRTLERLETKNSFTDQKITYTHKWKDRNVILVKTRYFSNNIPQLYNIDDYLMGDLFLFDADAMRNNIKNKKTYLGVEADIKFKQKRGDLFEFQFGYDHQDHSVATNFQLFDGTESFSPNGFQANTNYILGDAYLKTGYSWIWEKVTLNSKIEAHQLFNIFQSIGGEKKQNPFYTNPQVNFSWDVTPTHTLTASYRLRFRNTSLTEVNDSYLLTSSRSFHKGLGEFKLTDDQMAYIGYGIRHYINRYNFSLSLQYSTQSNLITYRSLVEQNSSLTQNILIKGGESYGGNFSSSFYWRDIKSQFNFQFNYSQSTFFNEVNNSGLRKNKGIFQRYKFDWASKFKIPFNFFVGTEWTESKIVSPDFENSSLYGLSYVELFYQLNDKMDIKINTEQYYFGNLEKGKRSYFFSDAEIIYKMKDDKYAISIIAKNLFNTENFTTFFVNELGYSSNSYRLMPRYVLVTFKIRF